MALTIKSDSSAEYSSLVTSSDVSDTAAAESANPRFESLPPEIRIMIYELLVPPTQSRKKCRKSYKETWCQSGCITHTANHAILSTNRNIRREASAVFYRKILLVSVDWNLSKSWAISGHLMPPYVAFRVVQKDAVLPPCVVRVQHTYPTQEHWASRTSTVVAAADFPGICRRLRRNLSFNYHRAIGLLFLVTSLPKLGYSADSLRMLIWSPLLAIQRLHGIDSGGKRHYRIRAADCTGIFEQSATLSDWDAETNGGARIGYMDTGGDTDSDAHHSDTETSSEEDSSEEDSSEEDSSEEDSSEEDSSEGDLEEDGRDDEESGGEKSDQGWNGDQEDSDQENSNHSGES